MAGSVELAGVRVLFGELVEQQIAHRAVEGLRDVTPDRRRDLRREELALLGVRPQRGTQGFGERVLARAHGRFSAGRRSRLARNFFRGFGRLLPERLRLIDVRLQHDPERIERRIRLRRRDRRRQRWSTRGDREGCDDKLTDGNDPREHVRSGSQTVYRGG